MHINMKFIYLVAFITVTFSSCENAENRLIDKLLNSKSDLSHNYQKKEENDMGVVVTSDNFYTNSPAILNSCSFSADSATKNRVEVKSTDGNFRIKFPYEPKQETDKRFLDEFEIKTIIYNLDIPKSGLIDNNLVYAISYSKDIKMSYYHSFDGYVKAQIAGNIRDVHAQLKSDKKLKLRKGAQGREQLYVLKGMSIEIKYRIIVFKNVIYTLSVATDKNHYNNAEASEFFNSFEFINS